MARIVARVRGVSVAYFVCWRRVRGVSAPEGITHHSGHRWDCSYVALWLVVVMVVVVAVVVAGPGPASSRGMYETPLRGDDRTI